MRRAILENYVTLAIDETETGISGSGTLVYPYDKSFVFVKDELFFRLNRLRIIFEAKAATTAYVQFYVDGVLRFSQSLTTTYTLYRTEIDTSLLSYGKHTLGVRAYHPASTTSYLRFYHVIGVL